MINKIKQMIHDYKNPKYRIMMGIKIDNRAIMFIGKNPIEPRDRKREIETHGYYDEMHDMLKISFENQKFTYYRSNTHKKIYTFKELVKWARLLPENKSRCLEYKNGSWNRIS